MSDEYTANEFTKKLTGFSKAASQNNFFKPMRSVGKILFIFLLIIPATFSNIDNEVDVLPFAKQIVNRNWLPNDWYLNLDIGYRLPFSLFIGHLVSWLGFEAGGYVGRLLIYLILGIAFYTLFRALQLKFPFGLLALLLFVSNQSLVAGEWIIDGAETKPIAYALAILSFAFFFRKRFLLGFAFAGAAISFHVLVGFHALFCTAVAILLNKEWRSQWRQYFIHSWPFFITASFGLVAITKQLFEQSNVDAHKAWEIYVQFRNPHHTLPSAWDGSLWVGLLILAIGLFLVMYFVGRSDAVRFVSAYALGSVLLFLFGLTLFALGETTLLRYYWFRFADVMIMFLSTVLIALVLDGIGDGRIFTDRFLYQFQLKLQPKLKYLLGRIAPTVIIYAAILMIFLSLYQLSTNYKNSRQSNTEPRISAFEWISEYTPKEAIFLVDPGMFDFYLHAERAMFVSWKHVPNSATDILEWYARIILCNGGRLPEKNGFDSVEELQSNFYKLDEKQIRQIADSYGISYYLGLPSQGLSFEMVYSNQSFAVYKINDNN